MIRYTPPPNPQDPFTFDEITHPDAPTGLFGSGNDTPLVLVEDDPSPNEAPSVIRLSPGTETDTYDEQDVTTHPGDLTTMRFRRLPGTFRIER